MNYFIKFLKAYSKNILFIFFIAVFSVFIFNNKSELIGLLKFNLANLFLLSIFFIIAYLIKTKLNQYLYLTKNIDMSFTETLKLIINSTAGNLSTPFSLGTGYKFHYLKKKYNLSYSQNININLYFSIFTNLIYVFFLLIISFLEYIQGKLIFSNLVLFWFLIFALGLLLFYLLSIEYEFGRLKFLNSYSLLSLNLPLSNIINMTIFTILLISVNGISHVYLFRLIDIQISIVQIFSFVCISGLANIIKFTPGNFGINETVLIVTNLYHGLTPLEVIVVSLIFRFFAWFNILIFYFILNIQKSNSKNGE